MALSQHEQVQQSEGGHLRCRFCGHALSHPVVDLGLQPPANRFRRPGELHQAESFYPTRVWVCAQCLLVQLEDYQSREDIFQNDYVYFSSYSSTWLKAAETYVQEISARYDIGSSSKVIEIASNDGYLLQYFVKRQVPVLGIEPAESVATAAERRGVPTLRRFFGRELGQEFAAQGTQADLMVANNVLAHTPDLHDFLAGFPYVLKPQGVLTIEFPHWLRTLEQSAFDTIYHEHYSYFSLLSVEKILAAHGLIVFDVEELPTQGGSLRLHVARRDSAFLRSARVEQILHAEQEAGLERPETYALLAERAARVKRRLLAFLIEAREHGKHIVGYGAAAKGNTLMNYCGIRQDFLDYLVDANPSKQDLYSPGTTIPVFLPERVFETRPDYILILPWNLEAEIMEKMAEIRTWGGQFVVALPELRILP